MHGRNKVIIGCVLLTYLSVETWRLLALIR